MSSHQDNMTPTSGGNNSLLDGKKMEKLDNIQHKILDSIDGKQKKQKQNHELEDQKKNKGPETLTNHVEGIECLFKICNEEYKQIRTHTNPRAKKKSVKTTQAKTNRKRKKRLKCNASNMSFPKDEIEGLKGIQESSNIIMEKKKKVSSHQDNMTPSTSGGNNSLLDSKDMEKLASIKQEVLDLIDEEHKYNLGGQKINYDSLENKKKNKGLETLKNHVEGIESFFQICDKEYKHIRTLTNSQAKKKTVETTQTKSKRKRKKRLKCNASNMSCPKDEIEDVKGNQESSNLVMEKQKKVSSHQDNITPSTSGENNSLLDSVFMDKMAILEQEIKDLNEGKNKYYSNKINQYKQKMKYDLKILKKKKELETLKIEIECGQTFIQTLNEFKQQTTCKDSQKNNRSMESTLNKTKVLPKKPPKLNISNMSLSKNEIEEDLKSIQELSNLVIEKKSIPSTSSSLLSNIRIENGKLLFNKRWYHRGQSIFVEGTQIEKFPAIISTICNEIVWVKNINENHKFRIKLSYLLQGKMAISCRTAE